MCFGIVYGDGRSVGIITSRLMGGSGDIGTQSVAEAGASRRRLASMNWGGGHDWLPLICANKTVIRWHLKIRGDANPYDPKWRPYFAERGTARRIGATGPDYRLS